MMPSATCCWCCVTHTTTWPSVRPATPYRRRYMTAKNAGCVTCRGPVNAVPWCSPRAGSCVPAVGAPSTERLASVAPLARYTRRYEQYLFEACRGTTIQAVHHREGLGYKAVEGV